MVAEQALGGLRDDDGCAVVDGDVHRLRDNCHHVIFHLGVAGEYDFGAVPQILDGVDDAGGVHATPPRMISGTMGVTSVILILTGGLYLFYTKTASRTIIISLVVTYAVSNQLLYFFGVDPVPPALPALLGGGFLFGAFFMATDPITAPKTEPARIFFGILIGLCTIVIRNFSIFNGGLMFSILIGNMFAPIMDYGVKAYRAGRARGVD